MFFILPYKEIFWLKLSPGTLHMYPRANEKDPLYYNYRYFIENNIGIICIITNKWQAVTKRSKSMSKETFVEGCSQTFEGYNLTFVYALVCMYVHIYACM